MRVFQKVLFWKFLTGRLFWKFCFEKNNGNYEKEVKNLLLASFMVSKLSHSKLSSFSKYGCCRQVLMTFLTITGWSLVVVDKWSLFRGSFSTKIAWAGFRVIVVDRWLLTQVWLYFNKLRNIPYWIGGK